MAYSRTQSRSGWSILGMARQPMLLTRILAFVFLPTFLAAQTVVLRTTNLIDGKGHVLKNKDIVIAGSRISAVRDGAKGPAAYDLSGLTVMPGWIDTHAHLGWFFNKENRLDQGGRGSKTTPQETALDTERSEERRGG